VSACLSVPRRIPILLHGRGCNLGGCVIGARPHGFRCYDNSAEREMSASACTRSVPGLSLFLEIRPKMSELFKLL